MTANILLLHFGIFIMTIILTLLLMRIKGARVTLWCLVIIAATPIINIWLLFVLIYELIIIFLEWRRR